MLAPRKRRVVRRQRGLPHSANAVRVQQLLYPDAMPVDTPLTQEATHLEQQRKTKVDDTVNYINLLLDRLDERNVPLFERIVCFCGTDVCQAVLAETTEAVERGGLVTTEGDRKRTKGGTFIHLLKQRLTKDQIDMIWSVQKRQQVEYKKSAKAGGSALDKIIAVEVRRRKRPRAEGEQYAASSLRDIEEGELYQKPKSARHG